MELTVALILLIVLAGFIKGFTGFGLSLVLISVLLKMGYTVAEFLPIVVPLFVVLDIILYWENRKNIKLDFNENFTLHPTTLMTLFIGILFGTYLLTVIDGEFLKISFAVLILILLFVLIEKVDIHQMRIPSERSNGFFGLGTGIMTGLFTINAIPPSIYLMYYQYPKEKYMANLITFIIFSDVILVAVYLSKDLFTLSGFMVSIQLFFMVLVGFLGGVYGRKYVSTSTFKSIVIIVLALNSLKIIFDYFVF